MRAHADILEHPNDLSPKTFRTRHRHIKGSGRIFGSSGAARYDKDAASMSRRYVQAHSTQNSIAALTIRQAIQPTIILDLGCGTASDGLSLLRRARNCFYIGVDSSASMLACARRKLAEAELSEKSSLLRRDFRRLSRAAILSAIPENIRAHGIGLVISALAMHHYSVGEKRKLYSFVSRLLTRGGRFVLTDLFTDEIPDCARSTLNLELTDVRRIAHRLEKRKASVGADSTVTEYHYTSENKPQPLAGELATLRGAGFDKADVIFRHGQLGVVVAER